jgi:AraC-like DNA-binding protein
MGNTSSSRWRSSRGPRPPDDGNADHQHVIDQDHAVGGAVREIVTTLLGDGAPPVHVVAALVGLSARTLQRRLHDEGVTFARGVTRVRFDVAQRMLADPGRKIIGVALDLGYSDPAHFTRAFARWTGLAPRAFRRLRSTGSPGRLAP